ncbi:hypothetical protein D0T12_18440 [Actinomadura spongiicola]|uniref:Uncharacterized protein n=1 Tax=Actinomadura spongiicola TaxID=2303421 RepID=A0A372GH43_9ACTN|nr:hypothetical protein D0T12_18440 [Actinomadura spongiicola]
MGHKPTHWNATAQVSALESLIAKLPDITAPLVEQKRPTPRRAKQLKAEQATELVQAYEAGATLHQLAARFGIHRATVSNILNRHRVKTRWRRLTEEDIDEAACLYEEGLSLARVAEQLGVSADGVRYQLRKRGVKMRGPHERKRS